MSHTFAITVPAATTAALPHTEHLKLRRGIISRVTVHFPAGCQYLVHVQLRDGGHQVWPEDDDKDLAYEDWTWESTVPYPFLSEPYELRFIAWSPSCDYAHVIRVGIDVAPEPGKTALDRLVETLTKFLRMLGVGT